MSSLGETTGRTVSDELGGGSNPALHEDVVQTVQRKSEDCTTRGINRRSHRSHRGRDGDSFKHSPRDWPTLSRE
jgi:hypothetical protein